MRIGCPKEIKNLEQRVALTPSGAEMLINKGHTVFIQQTAGLGSGFSDEDYRRIGAQIVSVEDAWNTDLVVKVKEPLATEYPNLKSQLLFTYLHLAGAPKALTETLLKQNTTALAYETVEDNAGKLPLLAPMSAVAGNMAVTMGSYYLASFNGGRGMQLGKVLGTTYGKVVIIGDGVVARHAAQTACGMGAKVLLASRHLERANALIGSISPDLGVFLSEPEYIAREINDADLVIGAVLRPGAKAPHVITEAMVQQMQPGSVIVDVSIDQGGCIETSRPTSHSDPVYIKHDIIHYCVTNMPGAYPRTSTIALTMATLPYIVKLANQGLAALREDRGFAKAVNTYQGYITYQPVAEAWLLKASYRNFEQLE